MDQETQPPQPVFGQIQQVIDQVREILGGLADKGHLLVLLTGEFPVNAVEQQPGEGQDRIDRDTALVTHMREKTRLHLIGTPQMPGLLIEFGVQRHHSTVGVLQLAVESPQLLLLLAQLRERV